MRRALIALPAVAATAAVASLALGGCGSATGGSAQTGAGLSGAPKAGQGSRDMTGVIATALDPLVEKGTITPAQQDAIAAALKNGTGGGPPQAIPPTEEQAPGATQPTPGAGQQPPQPGDMIAVVLDPLVADGTLSSTQATAVSRAIAEALPQGPAARAPPSSQDNT